MRFNLSLLVSIQINQSNMPIFDRGHHQYHIFGVVAGRDQVVSLNLFVLQSLYDVFSVQGKQVN